MVQVLALLHEQDMNNVGLACTDNKQLSLIIKLGHTIIIYGKLTRDDQFYVIICCQI
jgi:hypothetical protein